MFVCPSILELRFNVCCHPCYLTNLCPPIYLKSHLGIDLYLTHRNKKINWRVGRLPPPTIKGLITKLNVQNL